MVKAKPADPTATFHVSARARQKNQKRARLDREGEGKTFRAWPSPANGAGRPAVAGATERRCGGVMCRRGGATGVIESGGVVIAQSRGRPSEPGGGGGSPADARRAPRGGAINRSNQRGGFSGRTNQPERRLLSFPAPGFLVSGVGF